MDLADIKTCRDYFTKEDRDPTITEIKMIDTYWSDHCRHTTFNTVIDSVEFDDPMLAESYERYIRLRKELGRTKPVTLMDIGTIAAKYLKKAGKLDKLDESGGDQRLHSQDKGQCGRQGRGRLLLFKNETHNHPTEIEPFGGAATCVGGAIETRFGKMLCIFCHACDRSGRSAGAGFRDYRGAASAQAGDHCRRRIQLLWQPDRPCHRPGRRDLSSGLYRQENGKARYRSRPCGKCHQKSA